MAKKAQVADKDKGKGASKASQAAKGGPKKGKAKLNNEVFLTKSATRSSATKSPRFCALLEPSSARSSRLTDPSHVSLSATSSRRTSSNPEVNRRLTSLSAEESSPSPPPKSLPTKKQLPLPRKPRPSEIHLRFIRI